MREWISGRQKRLYQRQLYWRAVSAQQSDREAMEGRILCSDTNVLQPFLLFGEYRRIARRQ